MATNWPPSALAFAESHLLSGVFTTPFKELLPGTRPLEQLDELVAVLAGQRAGLCLAHVDGDLLQALRHEALLRLDEAHAVRVMDILLAAIPFAPVARTANLLANRVLVQDVGETVVRPRSH